MRLQLGSKVSRFESLNPVRDDSALSAQIGEGAAQSKATGTMPTLEIDASYVSRFRGQVIFEVPAARQVTRQVMVTDKIERLPCD